MTALILHENAFPAKVSLCPFGRTLRRFFENPRLRFLGCDAGAWAFSVTFDDAAPAPAPRPPADGPLPAASGALPLAGRSAPPTRFWRLDPPTAHAPAKARSFASIHNSGFGWLVGFAPDSCGTRRLSWYPDNGTKDNPWMRFEPPEGREIAFLACAESPDPEASAPVLDAIVPPDTAPLRLAAADLRHDAGQTEIDDGSLQFLPGRDAPCVAAEGPDLPAALPRGKVLLRLDCDPPAAFRLEPLYGLAPVPRSDRDEDRPAPPDLLADAEGPGAPVSVRVHWNGESAATLRAIEFIPLPDERPTSTPFSCNPESTTPKTHIQP